MANSPSCWGKGCCRAAEHWGRAVHKGGAAAKGQRCICLPASPGCTCQKRGVTATGLGQGEVAIASRGEPIHFLALVLLCPHPAGVAVRCGCDGVVSSTLFSFPGGSRSCSLICPWQRGWISARYAADPSAEENASFRLVGLLVVGEWTEMIPSAAKGCVGGMCVCLQARATLLRELLPWPDFSPCPALSVCHAVVSEAQLDAEMLLMR